MVHSDGLDAGVAGVAVLHLLEYGVHLVLPIHDLGVNQHLADDGDAGDVGLGDSNVGVLLEQHQAEVAWAIGGVFICVALAPVHVHGVAVGGVPEWGVLVAGLVADVVCRWKVGRLVEGGKVRWYGHGCRLGHSGSHLRKASNRPRLTLVQRLDMQYMAAVGGG